MEIEIEIYSDGGTEIIDISLWFTFLVVVAVVSDASVFISKITCRTLWISFSTHSEAQINSTWLIKGYVTIFDIYFEIFWISMKMQVLINFMHMQTSSKIAKFHRKNM